jgi:hypothetical protein
MNHLHQQHSQQPLIVTATTPFSSLYCVFIASVHLVHAMFTIPLHADSASLSSTSRVFCLIIIVTLQLLWWFAHVSSITVCYPEIPQALWQFETLRLFCDNRTHFLYFSYRPQFPFICQFLLRIVFLH